MRHIKIGARQGWIEGTRAMLRIETLDDVEDCTMRRILVVDDEARMRRALTIYLEARGYQVDPFGDAESALSHCWSSPHVAAIVDLGLPGRDGIELVRALRDHSTMPILVISGRHEASLKVAALDAGADDYVTKPFDIDELTARLRAALRRAEPVAEASPVVETPDFCIDLASKRVMNGDGVEIRLTPMQWRVVEILVSNPDRLVSQRALLEQVWGPESVRHSNYVRQILAQLRSKLEPDPAHPRYFVTEPGRGVRFLPPDAADGSLTPSASVDPARG